MIELTRREVLRRLAAGIGAASVGLGSPEDMLAQGRASSLQFEIYKDSRGSFRWRLKAANGRIMATASEGYSTKANCRGAIETIQRGAADASIEDRT